MLNSLQLQPTTDQFALKFKSMFNLAIATQQQQRYAHFPQQINNYDFEHEQAGAFLLNQRCHQRSHHRAATVTPPPSPTICNIPAQKKLILKEICDVPLALSSSSSFHMEEGRESNNDEIMRFNNNSSTEVGKVSHESSSSGGSGNVAINNLENTMMMSHINYNNNLIGGAVPFDQHLNFMNPRRRGCSSSDAGEGKQKGKKQGPPSGNKTPFSIESLLAHSNNWRRNQNQDFNPESGICGGRSGTAKEARFLPYVIPHQSQEQIRTSSRQGSPDERRAGKPSVSIEQHSENDKRPDSHDGINGSKSGGNGRRAGKSKRVRTIFTPEQLERLEAEFERQQYMVGPERLYLASSLYLTEAQVKVWFQNRRIKWRKQHLEMEQQRLAIYRTLAEQDMTSSIEGDDQEDSVDCEYAVDEGDLGGSGSVEDDERSVHSPSSSSRGNQLPPHLSQPGAPSHPHLPPNMFSPICENKPENNIMQGHPPTRNNLSTTQPPPPPPPTSSTQFNKAFGNNSSSSTTTHSHHHHNINKISETRFSQQQQQHRQSPSIDDYDYSLTNSSTSSPSSSRGTTTTTTSSSIQVGSHVVIQAGKK